MRHAKGLFRAYVIAAICLAAILALPVAAHAESWLSQYPYDTIHSQPSNVSVDIFGTAALSATSASIRLDGVARRTYLTQGTASGHWISEEVLVNGAWVIHWTWVADTGGTTKGHLYCYPPVLADGVHTVTATVKSTTGVTYTCPQWTFTVAQGPTISNVRPTADTTVTTLTPIVSAKITDNVGVTAVSATVNGVPATVGTPVSGVYPITGFTLADGPVTVAVTASDAAGNTTSKSWTFRVNTADATCIAAGCHPTYATGHMGNLACTQCHPDRIVPHGYSDASHTAAFTTTMAGTWTMAIQPTQMFAGELVNAPYTYSVGCPICHSPNLATEHGKATSAPVNSSVCLDCHPTPKDSIVGGWNKSCSTYGCHTASGHSHATTATVADHALASALTTSYPAAGALGCSATPGGPSYERTPCHTTDLIQEHNRKIGGVDVPGGWTQFIARTLSVSCEECHSSPAYAALNGSWSGSCDACHPASHAVVGSARYNQVYAQHQAPRYYDAGFTSPAGVEIAGSNAMDAMGPVRMRVAGSPVPYGCASSVCHLQFYSEAGLSNYYPAGDCAVCHGPNIAPMTAYQGSYMWRSGMWSDGANYVTALTLTVPGTLPAASALDFKTYYDIENSWDYGYVQVSTDSGATWTNLASTITTTTNPYGANLGNGITGMSGGWVDGHFELSAYAGQAVMIRFNYVADPYVYNEGWDIDLLTVGPAGSPVFADDVETLKPEWSVTSNRAMQWSR